MRIRGTIYLFSGFCGKCCFVGVNIVDRIAQTQQAPSDPQGVLGKPLARHTAYYAALERRQAQQGEVIRALYDDPLLTCAETMSVLRISYSLLRDWMKKGLIKSWRSSPRGRHRFRASEVERVKGLAVVE
jgi:hypothetical protein